MNKLGPNTTQESSNISFGSPKKAAIHKARELIEARVEFNRHFAHYFKHTTSDNALSVFLNHFVNPQSHSVTKRSNQEYIRTRTFHSHLSALCNLDKIFFEELLASFMFEEDDHIICYLFYMAQFRIINGKASEHLIDDEFTYFRTIVTVIAPYVDRNLYRFMMTNIQSTFPAATHLFLFVKLFQDVNNTIKELCLVEDKLTKEESFLLRSDLHEISQISHSLQNTKTGITTVQSASFLFKLYKCYQNMLSLKQKIAIVNLMAPMPTMILRDTLSLSPAAESSKENKAAALPEESEIRPGESEIHLGESEVCLEEKTFPKEIMIKAVALEEKENFPKEHFFSPRKIQKQRKLEEKRALLQYRKEEMYPPTDEFNAKEERLNYYRNKLSRQQNLMLDIFRQNKPHLEIKWSEIENLLNTIGAKMTEGKGSRLTLVLQENTLNERWATILQPLNLTQRGIHKSHKPGKSNDLVASVYIEIVRTALTRFGLTPQILWPEVELENLMRRANINH